MQLVEVGREELHGVGPEGECPNVPAALEDGMIDEGLSIERPRSRSAEDTGSGNQLRVPAQIHRSRMRVEPSTEEVAGKGHGL